VKKRSGKVQLQKDSFLPENQLITVLLKGGSEGPIENFKMGRRKVRCASQSFSLGFRLNSQEEREATTTQRKPGKSRT